MKKMKEMLSGIVKKPFFKSLIVLSGGTLLAQIVNFGFSMVMTRQYDAEAIGYFTYILSIVSMFSTVVNGRYDVSIVSSKDKTETLSLIKLSFYICLVSSFVIFVGSFFYMAAFHKQYSNFLYLSGFIFPLLIVYGLVNILNAYNNKFGEYKLISGAYLIRTIWQSVLTTIAGFFWANPFSLLSSQLIGQIFGIKKQAKRLLTERAELKSLKKGDLKLVAKQYRRQPVFSVPATLVNAVSYSLISIFIGDFFNMSMLAFYSISVRVLGLPLSIFSTNISKIHFREAEDEINESGCYKRCTAKMVLFSLVIAIFMVLILVLFAPAIFEIFYGSEWRISGVYVQILAPMFAFRMMVGAVGYSFIISEKQRTEFVFQLLLLVSLFATAISYKIFNFEINIFLMIISITYSVVYLAELLSIIWYSRMNMRKDLSNE